MVCVNGKDSKQPVISQRIYGGKVMKKEVHGKENHMLHKNLNTKSR